jgi:transposase
MSLHPEPIGAVPDETARIARAAFPRGNAWLRLRDELGTIYTDEPFAALFPTHGRPAEAPWRLALVTVLQFAEGLSDRQAAEAVRARLDWKYLLGLELDDPGFDFSVLSEFRARLLAGGTGQLLLDTLLAHCAARGWLKARGPQRTDSTHVLAAIRALNRLETVAETLRAALNAVAAVAPAWLRAQVDADWFDRYSVRIEESRLPKGQAAREQYAAQIGADGLRLLDAIYAPLAPDWLREVPAVQVLRRVWVQQYVTVEGHLRLRTAAELPPTGQRIGSPYDLDERFGNKRTATWDGYRVHVTETCGEGEVHLITHVDTTPAQVADADRAEPIQAALLAKGLPPREHFLDAGYVDAALLVRSRAEHGIEVVGPVRPDISWQARAPDRYDLAHFQIDWANRTVTCPQGRTNTAWTPHPDQWGNAVISIKFSRTDCLRCAARARCTRAVSSPRHLTLRHQADHQALQALRLQQQTELWLARYHRRAGIEGTLSQGVRAFELRRARYFGLAKTRLQHLATAVAINLVRLDAWLRGIPHARTRTSHFAALAPVAA